jgi:hypothetical protein
MFSDLIIFAIQVLISLEKIVLLSAPYIWSWIIQNGFACLIGATLGSVLSIVIMKLRNKKFVDSLSGF